jgi:hypothetical protein
MNSQSIATDQLPYQEYKNLELYQKEQIKQELRLRIQETLQIARTLPFDIGLEVIKKRLLNLQRYCQSKGKGFIFVEQEITCDQYKLQGSHRDAAILFRGPNEDASVAICLTYRGSLLYRNSSPWIIYRDAGDIGCPCGDACQYADSAIVD